MINLEIQLRLVKKIKALAVMEANDTNSQNTWLLDSGASNHMTPDVDTFSDAHEYSGKNRIIIGNRLRLSISHIGTAKLKSSNGLIPLRNTLCIP